MAKECPKCLTVKELSEFGPRFKHRDDILQSWCTDCRKEQTASKRPPSNKPIKSTAKVGSIRERYEKAFPQDKYPHRRTSPYMKSKLAQVLDGL